MECEHHQPQAVGSGVTRRMNLIGNKAGYEDGGLFPACLESMELSNPSHASKAAGVDNCALH
eukprot:7603160-Pyramimonas_sp.AAC.2